MLRSTIVKIFNPKFIIFLGYTKKTKLKKSSFENVPCSPHPDPPICHFFSAPNTMNFGLKFCIMIDLNIIYLYNVLTNILKHKNADFIFFKIMGSLELLLHLSSLSL